MVRKGVYAVYKGKYFRFKEAVNNENIILIGYENEEEVLLGFKASLDDNGLFYKEIKKNEVKEAYYVIPRAVYQGLEFALSDGRNGKALLDTDDAWVAQKYGFERTDKYMYSKYVDWGEIEIIEKNTPYTIK